MIPSSAVADARAAQAQTGASNLAAALALAVAGPESAWNPSDPGDYMLNGRIVPRGTPGAIPTSWGYTQLHTNAGGDSGGLGNGHDVSELTNGVTNFAIAMQVIQDKLSAGASPREALSDWTTRDTALANLQEAAAALGANISGDITAGPGAGAIGGSQAWPSWLKTAAWIAGGLIALDLVLGE